MEEVQKVMKVFRYFMILVSLLILSGCTQAITTPVDTQTEKLTPPEEKVTPPEQYETTLVFITKTDDLWQVVDERGNIHQVKASQFDLPTQAGCTTRGKVTISPTGEISLEVDAGWSMSYVQLVKASYEEAPLVSLVIPLSNMLLI